MYFHVHPLPGGSTVADGHVYVVEWEPGEIRFYVYDQLTGTHRHWWSCRKTVAGAGIEQRRASDLNPWPAPFDQPIDLVMNVAVGGNFPDLPNTATCFPAELVVDDVRVYEKVGGYGPTVPAPRVLSPGKRSPDGAARSKPSSRATNGQTQHSGAALARVQEAPGTQASFWSDGGRERLRAAVASSLARGVHGLCFSPHLEGQVPGDAISAAQIRARLELIQPHTRWVRTFSCTDGHKHTPRIAHELGLKTLVGCWLGSDAAINRREIEGVIAVAQAGHADIVAVGNEVLLQCWR